MSKYSLLKFFFASILGMIWNYCCFAQQTGKWGDQGDGTYRNPILPSDYSDPDVIRVGSDYYLISSTFHFSPGMVILHSNDMVNWETVGYAVDDLTKLGPELNWDKMNRYNTGIYAGSIRYHKGIFYIHFHSYLEGFFVATATNPAGPWKVQPMLDKNNKPLRVPKWDDVCPFWDDDGKAYMVGSKPNGAWYPHLFRMSEDGVKLLDADSASMVKTGPQPEGEGAVIYDKRSAEGNKIYKIDGYYYLFHNEVTKPENVRIGMMKRSRYIYMVRFRTVSPVQLSTPVFMRYAKCSGSPTLTIGNPIRVAFCKHPKANGILSPTRVMPAPKAERLTYCPYNGKTGGQFRDSRIVKVSVP